MASQTFTFTRDDAGDADSFDSTPIVIGAGEAVRVRFSDFSGALAQRADAFLVIDANTVESRALIDNPEAWATGAVIAGDSVSVRVDFDGAFGTVAGIIESFAS